MYQRVLFALDLEGVNYVVGEPYVGLSRSSEQGQIAIRQAVLEVNAAADALFAAGVETVGLWDNHGGGGNIDPAALDPRITFLSVDTAEPRMSFARGKYDCLCFFGYHAMEGTLGGVLAHTMNSKAVQHYKLNGRHIGEVDMDAYIAADLGIPARFFAGGNIACKQASRAVSGILTVTTKQELSRNRAIFRDNEELLDEIRKTVVRAVQTEAKPCPLSFPAVFEKSFKRVEDAEKYLARVLAGGICADYADDEILGKDGHCVVSTVQDMEAFIKAI